MRRTVKLLKAVLSLCLLQIILASCRGELPSADWGLLTGEPCEPPCWQGLTPGYSTGDEVDSFLESSDLVDRASVWQDRGGCGLIVHWRSPTSYRRGGGLSSHQSNWLCVGDGILREMEVSLDYDFAIEQLLARYGPPEKLDAVRGGPPERPYVAVPLYYPERGMMAQVELPLNDIQLRPETKVVRVWYMHPTTLEEMGAALGVAHPEDFAESLQEWQGYGPIEVE